MPAPLVELLAGARDRLTRAGLAREDAAFDAEVLARHVLDWDRSTFLARLREAPPGDFSERFEPLLARREQREPVALIVGHKEFWGREFEVTRDVLIPRPETELIVETVLDAARTPAPGRIVDVGTGSGCLAVTLAAELPRARVVAVDTSAAALSVARRNAQRHAVSERVTLLQASLLDAISGPVDLIVSNPPYVPSGERLPPEVALYEPPAALFAGEDGLDVIRELIRSAPSRLAPRGALVMEFGFGQRDPVVALARAAGWHHVTVHHDLQGGARVIDCRLPSDD